jgi:predicted DNA-binding protein
MPTATKSYSLDISVIDTIARLARDHNKKQSWIIKDAIESYVDLVNEAIENKEIADACKRGEMKTYSADEARAIINAA